MFLKNQFYLLIFLTVITIAPPANAQSNKLSCAELKNGIFHVYPKNSIKHYTSIRESDLQKEVNVENGDSTLWKITWINDCSYSLKQISTSEKLDEKAVSFFKKHKLAYQITHVTEDYYVYKGYVDNISGDPFQTDTMWLKEKTLITDNSLIQKITNPSILKKQHFSDTSQYAVLYIYRPGKLTNSLANYPIYFDENLICIAKNKSGYMFKILKEGVFEIKSKLFKDESSATLNIKFGNRYYIKSMIHFGIFKRGYNFKLEMVSTKAEEGKEAFLDVNLQ